MSEVIGEQAGSFWFEAYARGCSEAAHLYATAFDRMTVEMGEETALALAPVVLRDVVAIAQEHALRAEAQQMELERQRREQQLWEAQQQMVAARPLMPENPW